MKFMVVCQHALFSASLCALVKKYKKGVEVIESSSADGATDTLSQQGGIAMIVFYMQLTDASWDDLKDLHENSPEIPILVIADFDSDGQIRKAIYTGANGCVSSNFTWRTVTTVIQRVLDGEIVSPSIHYKVEKSPEVLSQTGSYEPSRKTTPPQVAKLTARQQEVLKLIQSGRSNKEIAQKLEMAIPTVKIHCAAIYKEIGVKNRTQAAMEAEKYMT
jgi:DNA-binding NarL/FixJ family response regulator